MTIIEHLNDIGKILWELRSALLDGLVSNMADERTLIGEIIQRGD